MRWCLHRQCKALHSVRQSDCFNGSWTKFSMNFQKQSTWVQIQISEKGSRVRIKNIIDVDLCGWDGLPESVTIGDPSRPIETEVWMIAVTSGSTSKSYRNEQNYTVVAERSHLDWRIKGRHVKNSVGNSSMSSLWIRVMKLIGDRDCLSTVHTDASPLINYSWNGSWDDLIWVSVVIQL